MPEKPFKELSKAEQRRRKADKRESEAAARDKRLKDRPKFAKFRNPMFAERFEAKMELFGSRKAAKTARGKFLVG